VQATVKRCHEESGDDGFGTVQSGEGRAVGDSGYTITQRFRGPYGFDTGLVVYDLVRVGDLLLLDWQYGEGGGSGETIEQSRSRVTDQSDDLLPELCEYAEPACAVREPVPVVGVGPDGVEDVLLGMSEEAAAKAGLLGEPRHDGSGCTFAWRDDASGTYAVTADVRPGVGVVSVSATTDTVTPEGVGTRSTVDEVRAAYPDAIDQKTAWMAPVPGRPDRSYWFLLAPDGLVTRVLLVLTEERCQA
jgi:hypothetical protein